MTSHKVICGGRNSSLPFTANPQREGNAYTVWPLKIPPSRLLPQQQSEIGLLTWKKYFVTTIPQGQRNNKDLVIGKTIADSFVNIIQG